jgi:hypothetical protein
MTAIPREFTEGSMIDIGGTAQPSDKGIADTIVSDGPVVRLLD